MGGMGMGMVEMCMGLRVPSYVACGGVLHFVPLPFHWYAHPKTPYEKFRNNEHQHVFAVHRTHTTSMCNYMHSERRNSAGDGSLGPIANHIFPQFLAILATS